MEVKTESNIFNGYTNNSNNGSNTNSNNSSATLPNSAATNVSANHTINPDVEVEFEVTYPIRSHHPVCALWNAAWLVIFIVIINTVFHFYTIISLTQLFS